MTLIVGSLSKADHYSVVPGEPRWIEGDRAVRIAEDVPDHAGLKIVTGTRHIVEISPRRGHPTYALGGMECYRISDVSSSPFKTRTSLASMAERF
jgi:hypothetical protein